MSRKACKRKPRGSGLAPIYGFDEKLTNELFVYPYEYLDGMKTGEGSEEGAHCLVAITKICERLARQYTDEVQAIAKQGVEAANAIFTRFADLSRWGCSGDDYRAISSALNLFVQIKESGVRRREIAEAINETLGWKR